MRSLLPIVAMGIVAGLFLCVPAALAQTTGGSVSGSLVTLVNSGLYPFNRLEHLSATANQDTYNQLVGVWGPSGACANVTSVAQATPSCPAATFLVFDNVRELVQSANEILGNGGPTQYSLRLDPEGLGFALRWTAAEEAAAPGSASTEFANTQIASVMSRITALRYGATGFSVAQTANTPLGGSAGADAVGGGRWGGFLNGDFAYGTRKPTELEDAFAFDGQDLTLGVDYRFTRSFVFGMMVGHARQRIDFDSTQSVVDGGVESSGYSVTAYGLYDWNGPYMSVAIEWQKMSIDLTRVITYPSFNINVESVYATAFGSTSSTAFTGSFDFGWSISARAFGFDPYLRLEYRKIGIDAFNETSVDNIAGANYGKSAGFDLAYADQHMHSLDGTLGLKIQYAFKPNFGVIVPYIKGEWHHNFDTDPFTVTSIYNGQSSGSTGFALPSDARAASFRIYAAGASVVLHRGWQAFAQFQTMSGIDYLDHRVISGGIRGEF